MMTDLIVFDDFSFQYETQAEPTLKNINLSIQEGEKILLVGPSGSGKSTLGQLINGLIPNHHKGKMTDRFLMAGQPSFEQSIYDKSKLVSTVLQDTDGQFIGLSVAEDIAFALENDQVPEKEMKEKVEMWSKRLGLENLLQHRPQDLSGGQKQRVSLAGVLIDESPILVFDEPLANLDPKSSQDMLALIDSIHKSEKVTTLIIEHRLEEVLAASVDRVILMAEGEVIFDGQPDDLLLTTLLKEQGIREPLYLGFLREQGLDLTSLSSLSQLEGMDLPKLSLPTIDSYQSSKPSEDVLVVKDLEVSYGDGQPILSDISFTVKKGERLALIGQNGAGKSTLAKALCQFVESSQGQIFYQGQDISADTIKERAERIGYVLQNPNQMISQTMIFDEVALGLRLRQVSEADVKERVEKTLKICGLYPYRHWPIAALSFGQKKRVTIASILVLNPEIILLDEPTAGQDFQHYSEIMAFLDQLNQAGHTIIMITHDMQLMLEHSDRALVLAKGQILADDQPIQILKQKDILTQANLCQPSLFALADKLGLDVEQVVNHYTLRNKGEHHADK
ncbi:ABC transporter ATP-binding protein [Streptococcus sp. sy010]|nr:ABC transporter ATP-binding protein [Streptococcus sp. sy010]TWT16341.1 ABC transporter ATP-binding protein [Streptococcus sp. sy010]